MPVAGEWCPDCGAVFEKGVRHTCPHPEVKIARLEAELAGWRELAGKRSSDINGLCEKLTAERARRAEAEEQAETYLVNQRTLEHNAKVASHNEATATARADALAKMCRDEAKWIEGNTLTRSDQLGVATRLRAAADSERSEEGS